MGLIWSQSYTDKFNLANVDVTVSGSAPVNGFNYPANTVFTFTARLGYLFTFNIQRPTDPNFISVSFWNDDGFYGSWANNNAEKDFKSGTWKVPIGSDAWGFDEVTTVENATPTIKGNNNVYEIDSNQLVTITNSRFVVYRPEEPAVDYGKYFIGLINLPFEIDPDLIVEQANVKLGSYDTEIPVDKLDVDYLELDLGEISIVGNNKNLADYKNRKAILHLPYAESVELDLDYVIDETVKISYKISLYDGSAIVNIKSSKTDETILTKNVDLNIRIPFSNIETSPTKNNPFSMELGGENGVTKAFIELYDSNSDLNNGFFSVPVNVEGTISGYTGFVQVDEIELKSKSTAYEKSMIINKLKEGVIVK